ncbi:Phage major tail protein 2 [compost metagenome]
MALNCDTTKYVGREVVVEFALACGDIDPGTLSFLPIGALRGKEVNLEMDTVDATADDSVGSFRENLVTYKTFSFSGDGVAKRADGVLSNQTALYKHTFEDPQPVAWFRFTFPDVTITSFMIISTFSRSATYDDVVTFSLEASTTASDFGVIIEDTP